MKFNLLATTVAAFFAITAMAAPVEDASALEGLLAREPSPQAAALFCIASCRTRGLCCNTSNLQCRGC
ncbi:hypothetical protein CC1G_05370 [Coprinopsis cinerea okayama7|uniref:Uncharacterized protein n=1 Tax=Coprinopsis cinerea (strain Okayama-7 / 130 / ATCC MYA-4618 / FGSC 9003) TaxID=240176 RepID=A8NPV0_COPC7|nr:hypothetical protein CC1G_05370 [Coprinopsis cinerea okayama7\|eukprot:XP_001835408.2 hypothetical protein CC1G_05370 [Coprinopsis cinerea okayama7\